MSSHSQNSSDELEYQLLLQEVEDLIEEHDQLSKQIEQSDNNQNHLITYLIEQNELKDEFKEYIISEKPQ